MKRWADAFRNLKLRQKLMLSCLSVVFVMLLTLSFYFYFRFRDLVNDEFVSGFDHTSTQITDNMNYKISKINELVDQIAYNEKIQSVLSNPTDDILLLTENYNSFVLPVVSNTMVLNDEILQLTLYTMTDMPESGRIVLQYAAIAQTAWAKEATAAPDTRVRWYMEDGKLFAVKKYINTYNNDTIGLIYAQIKTGMLSPGDALGKTDLLAARINDRDGAPVLALTGQNPLQLKAPKAVSAGRVYGFDGKLFLRQTISDTDFTVDFYMDYRGLREEISSIRLQILSVAILLFILFGVAVHTISKWILTGVVRLSGYMDVVKSGNLNAEIAAAGNDEIGDLTRDFAFMMRRINDLIEQVYITKLKLQEAEFTALQAQISPHFLYNVLSLINWRALDLGADDISFVAVALSRFYRTALSNSRRMISVREEIENVVSYINIQLVLHDNGFDVEYSLDDDAMDFSIPKLILQPIVENAITHGIEKKRNGRGSLKISSHAQDGDVDFRVTDNGPGITKDNQASSSKGGYGMLNVQERLELLYGIGYGVQLSRQGDSTVAVLHARDYRLMGEPPYQAGQEPPPVPY